MTTINSISFVRKGERISAIINNEFSVVLIDGKFNVYHNTSRGVDMEATPELIQQFSDAFIANQEAREKAREDARIEAARIERERIEAIKESVTGLTPQDFEREFGIKAVETASHWSDLYEGRSSLAFIISSDKELELLETAISVNNWEGKFGELCNRAGEHHHTFSSVYDLADYRKNCERYFDDKYFAKSKEIEHDSYLERIKEAEDIDDVRTLLAEFDSIEEGYYSCGGSLVKEGFDFDDFWGYYYDVYSYSFCYKLPSKDFYYNGFEEEIEETEE